MISRLLMALAIFMPLAAHASDPVCKEAYDRLYNKPKVDVRVVFGYKDARPARFVGDRHERLAFVQKITAKCEGPDDNACGFVRSSHNADLFEKSIRTPAGRKVTVELRVTHSSVGSDDASNRVDPFQSWQSVYARRTFLMGIESADVVLYNGHSRFGGGPDFDPPKLRKTQEINASYYKTKRPGLKETVAALKSRPKGRDPKKSLKILGMFSCESSQHFTEEIQKRSATALITSKGLLYYADAFQNSLAALDSLLGSRCERGFKSALRQGDDESGSRLAGFFKPQNNSRMNASRQRP